VTFYKHLVAKISQYSSETTLFEATLTILSIVAAMPTTRFNVQEFYVLPRNLTEFFFMVLKTNNDYFPVQKWLTGFITMTDCVYSAVRT